MHFNKPLIQLFQIPLLILCNVATANAAFSNNVSRAMDEANTCRDAQQILIYQQCMQQNNQEIYQSIKRTFSTNASSFSSSEKKRVLNNLEKTIKKNSKYCLNENTQFKDSMSGQRRHEYCIYENLLEVLINVERNIEIYSQ